jgi:hypothetical protein
MPRRDGMVQVISVEPVNVGWAVRQEGVEPPQIFTSGARAEDAARQLGERLCRSGSPAEIRIWLRDGALGGRFVCAG